MSLLTTQQVRERLQSMCDLAGGQRSFAAAHSLRESLISETLHAKRKPGAAILAALGLTGVRRFTETRKGNQ